MIGNRFKTVILLSFLAVFFIVVGRFFFGSIGLYIGLSIAVLINFGSYWFSDKIVLKMHNAKQVHSGRLFDITKNLANRAKMPMPKVYMIHAPYPNAFATGRSPKHSAVAATKQLMDILSDEELEGVMAHELSHVKHRDTLIQTIAVAITTAIAFIAEMMQWALIFGFGGNDEEGGVGSIVGSIALLILAPIIAMIIQLAISRQREFLADAGAVKLTKSAEPLIRALQKLENSVKTSPSPSKSPAESLYIVNPFKGSMVASLFSTHPKTEDRIKKMREINIHKL